MYRYILINDRIVILDSSVPCLRHDVMLDPDRKPAVQHSVFLLLSGICQNFP